MNLHAFLLVRRLAVKLNSWQRHLCSILKTPHSLFTVRLIYLCKKHKVMPKSYRIYKQRAVNSTQLQYYRMYQRCISYINSFLCCFKFRIVIQLKMLHQLNNILLSPWDLQAPLIALIPLKWDFSICPYSLIINI